MGRPVPRDGTTRAFGDGLEPRDGTAPKPGHPLRDDGGPATGPLKINFTWPVPLHPKEPHLWATGAFPWEFSGGLLGVARTELVLQPFPPQPPLAFLAFPASRAARRPGR